MNALAAALPLALVLSASYDFETAKKKAGTVKTVGKAISVVVGNCNSDDMGERYDCQENMKKARKDFMGKRLYLYLGTVEANQLQFEGDHKGKVRVVWTAPIYDAGRGLALTLGKPQRVSPRGTLVIRPAILDGDLGEGVLDSEIPRLIRTGQVAVELVGSFEAPWKLSGKGRTYQGASFGAEAVRLTHARTGKTLMVAKL